IDEMLARKGVESLDPIPPKTRKPDERSSGSKPVTTAQAAAGMSQQEVKDLQRQLAKIEKEIGECEKTIAEKEVQLADPEFYTSPDFQQEVKKYEEVKRHLE